MTHLLSGGKVEASGVILTERVFSGVILKSASNFVILTERVFEVRVCRSLKEITEQMSLRPEGKRPKDLRCIWFRGNPWTVDPSVRITPPRQFLSVNQVILTEQAKTICLAGMLTLRLLASRCLKALSDRRICVAPVGA